MMMDDYKISDNFQRTEGCKMISPHHFHPTMGPSDSSRIINNVGAQYDQETEHGTNGDKQKEWQGKYN